MIHFVILFSRQGKLRLQKWWVWKYKYKYKYKYFGQLATVAQHNSFSRYEAKEAKEKKKICRELTSAILLRFAISYFARSIKLN